MYRLPTLVWFTRTVVATVGGSGCLLGFMFFLGGNVRFQSPALLYARSIPGGAYTWGVLFFLAGAGAIAGIFHGWHPKTLAISLWALSTAYLFFAISIWLSLATSAPNSPLTGGVTYLELAGVCLLCGAAARRLKP